MSNGKIVQKFGELYPGMNGGYRFWRAVKMFLYLERKNGYSLIRIKVPGYIILEKKISLEECFRIAGMAINARLSQ